MMQELKRGLRLTDLLAYGVGMILGAGIYALIGKGAELAGSALWISLIFGALIASTTGLAYAELTTMIPREGAEYYYVKNAFNEFFAFLIGWLMLFTQWIGVATIALGFGGYFHGIFGVDTVISAIVAIILLSFLNFYGIEESSKVNIIFTLIEVSGLILIIYLGLPYIGKVDYFTFPSFSGLFSAAIIMFFAYLGFEGVVNLSEEVENPIRDVPRALVLSIFITTLIYVLVAISVVSILSPEILGKSSSPLADAARAAMPRGYFLLSIVALFATLNTVLIVLIINSRVIYGMAADNALPNIFLRIHSKRRTPWLAIILSMLCSMFFVLWKDIAMVAEISSSGAFLIFIFVNASLIALRYKKGYGKFRVPLNIGRFPVLPAFGILFSIFILMHMHRITFIMLIFILLSGALVYWLRKLQ